MRKKIEAIALAFALLVGTAVASEYQGEYEADPFLYTIVGPQASAQIRQYSTSLSVNASGQLVVSYGIFGVENPMIELGAYSIKIQQKVTSTKWQTLQTIDGTSSNDQWYHTQEEIVDVAVGIYRAEIELFATNAAGTDTRTAYTVEKAVA